ncbi:MAG: GGDEF domain-containing protein, partial [Bacillota bacterium]|nr:GGDEF domain-containing protein [Bacillota bacterium]
EQLKRALEDLESYNRILHLQSLCDELTGLYNRRGFITLANERIARLKGPNSGCLIFYADLDGLKQINDTYGHAEGDFTLTKAAELLTQAFKSTDIIGRIGGDEFTVLVIGAAERDKNYIWNQVKLLYDNFNKTSGKPYNISISAGCVYFKSNVGFNLDELLRSADLELYIEKQRKKSVHKKK